jgi:hypothetical protein
VIGLFKTEVIRRRGPWRHLEAVEFVKPPGYVPPAAYAARYDEQAVVA